MMVRMTMIVMMLVLVVMAVIVAVIVAVVGGAVRDEGFAVAGAPAAILEIGADVQRLQVREGLLQPLRKIAGFDARVRPVELLVTDPLGAGFGEATVLLRAREDHRHRRFGPQHPAGMGLIGEDRDLAAVRAGKPIIPVLRRLARHLRLSPDALEALALRRWYPQQAIFPRGFAAFNTPCGDMTVNSYLVWDTREKVAAAFDTGADATEMLDLIRAEGLRLRYIFLTHTHHDHVGGLTQLAGETGAEVWYQGNITAPPTGVGLTFNAGATSLPASLSITGGNTPGFPYASFLLGAVSQAQQIAPVDARMFKKQWALFLQDSWKATRKLTLDYGLRWDYATPGQEQYGRSSNLGFLPNANAGGRIGAAIFESDRKSTRLNSSHVKRSRMPSSA